jgi:hypothetical protein
MVKMDVFVGLGEKIQKTIAEQFDESILAI